MLSKNFLMDAITVGERKVFPVVSLEIYYSNNAFLSINYTIVAFKVIENELTYWINNSLSKKEFNKIKKLREGK